MLSALKRLLRHPGYFAMLVLVMATGLGGALSLYGISDVVLFRPLKVENADTLVRVFRSDETLTKRDNWSRPVIRDYLGGNKAFADVAYYAAWPQLAYAPPGQDAATLHGALVSGNFFEVLGTLPVQGRLLQPADDVEGTGIAGVLSFEIWHSRFNARKDIIGEAITLNDQPVTIVGVAPPGFSGAELTSSPDIWLPVNSATHMALPSMPTQQFLHSPNMSWLNAVARLAPGVTLDQAKASLEAARLAHGDTAIAWPPAKTFLAREVAVDPYGNQNIETVAWILFGMVGVLLIVVCADAAGLMLIRAEATRAETGIRLSLGATRKRIAADVLCEAAIIVGAAGILAWLFALLISGWLQKSIGIELALPQEQDAVIFNTRVFVAFGGMLLMAVILSSLAPIQRLGLSRLMDVLRDTRHGDSRKTVNLRDGLVIIQVGVSVLLLTVSIMFAGALHETLAIDPGFKLDNRAMAQVSLPSSGQRGAAAYLPLLRELRNDPRVNHAAVAFMVPISDAGMRNDIVPQGYTPSPDESMHVDISPISDSYFETMGIPLLRGRDFAPASLAGDGPKQIVVNEAFVARYWPGRNGIGMQVEIGEEAAEVIGVVANSKQRDLREPPRPLIYTSFDSMWMTSLGVVVAAQNADMAMNAIRDAANETTVRAVLRVESLQARIDRRTARDRALTWLAVGAAIFATLLAVVGMYGVAAYAARQRQREIGIRYALGATRPQVVTQQFLRRGLIVALCGIGVGLLLTAFTSRYLAGAVAGVEQHNAPALVFAGLLFASIALIANLIPVWRAANVAPMDVLRDE